MPRAIASNEVDESYWVVVTDNQYGNGIFSIHAHLEHAEHNAELVEGQVVPIDQLTGVVNPPDDDADIYSDHE